MSRLTHTLGSALAAMVMLAGCSEHYTTQEAYDICEEEQVRHPNLMTDESFASCVSCYEECGSECEPGSDMPLMFACPD